MAANMKGGGRKISLQSYFEPKIAPLAAASWMQWGGLPRMRNSSATHDPAPRQPPSKPAQPQ